MKTDALLDHLSQLHPRGYDLSLGRITDLLKKLGQPHKQLPPVFHVAGTNGKGSVIANLQALLEAAGFGVHAHTSPHLVNYHERYRLAEPGSDRRKTSKFASDDMLAEALGRVAKANDGAKITVFELLTATMFVLFSEQPADYALIEVGLGGRFDSTNVIDTPLVAVITKISLDHQSHLGDTIEKIAFEKAGIIKPGGAVVIGPQSDEARAVLENRARQDNCPMMVAGQDFDFYQQAGRFIYQDNIGLLDLPMPALLGEHQLANSATAIAAIRMAGIDITNIAIESAMKHLQWPGRFERLAPGNITAKFGKDTEIWIDGGHNAGAGAVIASELQELNQRNPKKLTMISAMLASKNAREYFENFTTLEPELFAITAPNSNHAISAINLAASARKAGINAVSCNTLDKAITKAAKNSANARVLISGTLYLVGEILKLNNTAPQ